MKQTKKGKFCFVIYIAGERFIFSQRMQHTHWRVSVSVCLFHCTHTHIHTLMCQFHSRHTHATRPSYTHKEKRNKTKYRNATRPWCLLYWMPLNLTEMRPTITAKETLMPLVLDASQLDATCTWMCAKAWQLKLLHQQHGPKKETYYRRKWDLLSQQKRPNLAARPRVRC